MTDEEKELKLEDFIYQVKEELTEAKEKHAKDIAYFELEKVELEVTVRIHRQTGGKVHLYVVSVGKDRAKENVHTVKLSFGIVGAKQKASDMDDLLKRVNDEYSNKAHGPLVRDNPPNFYVTTQPP